MERLKTFRRISQTTPVVFLLPGSLCVQPPTTPIPLAAILSVRASSQP
jgi:hypothetical protein